jgi:hypothetical protein
VKKFFPGLAVSLLSLSAAAHPKGVHERLAMTVRARDVEILMTLDADSGGPGQLLRLGADVDQNGHIGKAEQDALKRNLARRMRDALTVQISGYPLQWRERGVKMDLRNSTRVDSEGLSVAVLLNATLPEAPSEGMELVMEHRGTGASHVLADVFVDDKSDGGGGYMGARQAELLPRKPLRIRLRGLK